MAKTIALELDCSEIDKCANCSGNCAPLRVKSALKGVIVHSLDEARVSAVRAVSHGRVGPIQMESDHGIEYFNVTCSQRKPQEASNYQGILTVSL